MLQATLGAATVQTEAQTYTVEESVIFCGQVALGLLAQYLWICL